MKLQEIPAISGASTCHGKDEHGKVAINIILIADEAKSKVCILTRIASPDAARKHAPEWGKIVGSLGAPKAKKATPKKEE